MLHDPDANDIASFSHDKVHSVVNEFSSLLKEPEKPSNEALLPPHPNLLPEASSASHLPAPTTTLKSTAAAIDSPLVGRPAFSERYTAFRQQNPERYQRQLQRAKEKRAARRLEEEAARAANPEKFAAPVEGRKAGRPKFYDPSDPTPAYSTMWGQKHPEKYQEKMERSKERRRQRMIGPKNKRGPKLGLPFDELSASGQAYRLKKLQDSLLAESSKPNPPGAYGPKNVRPWEELSKSGRQYRAQREKVWRVAGLDQSTSESPAHELSDAIDHGSGQHSSSTTSWMSDLAAHPNHADTARSIRRRDLARVETTIRSASIAESVARRGVAEDLVLQLASNPSAKRVKLSSASATHLAQPSDLTRAAQTDSPNTVRSRSAFQPYIRPGSSKSQALPQTVSSDMEGPDLRRMRSDPVTPLASPSLVPVTPAQVPETALGPHGIRYGDPEDYVAPARGRPRRPVSELQGRYRKLREDEARYQAHLARVRDRRREKQIAAMGGPAARVLKRGRQADPEYEPKTRNGRRYRERPEVRERQATQRRLQRLAAKLAKAEASTQAPNAPASMSPFSTERLPSTGRLNAGFAPQPAQPTPTPETSSLLGHPQFISPSHTHLHRRSPSPLPPLPHFHLEPDLASPTLERTLTAADSSAASSTSGGPQSPSWPSDLLAGQQGASASLTPPVRQVVRVRCLRLS